MVSYLTIVSTFCLRNRKMAGMRTKEREAVKEVIPSMRTRASSEALEEPSCVERSSSLSTIWSFIPEESAEKDP